jgi:hypothetical protein
MERVLPRSLRTFAVPVSVAAILVLLAPASAVADGGGGPSASFVFAPAAPPAGQPVVFTSTSTPSDAIVNTLWDFDGDGAFDALGTSVTTAFAAAGPHLVHLAVIDQNGDAGIADQTIEVGPPLPAAPTPPPVQPLAVPSPAPGLMNPFPVVRMQGRILRRGVRVTRLAVNAPAGALVRGVCSGRKRGCPRRAVVRRSRSSARPVRLRPLERRLRAGAVIQVFVTDPHAIGKYVSFRVRRGGAPFRRDLCVPAAGFKPVTCPGQ